MNAIDMLKAQHRQVERQFEAIRSAEGDEKLRLFFELADSLAIHAAIEERHFYPAVRERRTEARVAESLDEHRAVKRTLSDLLRTDVGDAAFDVKLALLEDMVSRHVGEEEGDLFPRVARILEAEQLEQIGDDMIATASELTDSEHQPELGGEGEGEPLH